MRFISIHTSNVYSESDAPPPPGLAEGMGALVGEMVAAGAFEAAEGLKASRHGLRLKYTGGQASVASGPFTPQNELTAALTVVKAMSIEEARPWADRHGEIFRDVEIDLRPVCEPWDIGMAPPPPAGTPRRFMLQFKADARYETGAPFSSGEEAALARLYGEMEKAGVLVVSEGIAPSSGGLRIQYDHARGERRVTDGPFAESKELIAGFCIMNVKDLDEAVRWTDRFASHFPQVGVEIRALQRQQ
ncbi:MAG TPA: YciI family protein [Burkholderiales bacterium]|jgi:hypothetical protein|nr:YciI family protein [Burkholderiales bacterium]